MANEKFHFTTPAGKKIAVPKFKHLPVGVVRRSRNLAPAEQIFAAIEAVCDDKTLTLIDAMTAEDLNGFVKAWQSDSGVTAGESPAS